MSFQSPWAFVLFIPWSFLLLRRWVKGFGNASLQFSQIQHIKNLSPSLRARLAHVPEYFKYLGLAFFIIALARPQSSDTRTQKSIDGIDIIIALDISDSMLIEDMVPFNRLEAAKETIRQFVKARNSDRIGVVIFAGEAFTLVPPTLDYDLILSRVAEITTALEAHIKDGTAIGVAIANASGKLKDSTARSRVMIFMTDGGNNCGLIDPETGLAIAKGYGIKVYSIGIGKGGPSRIPIYTRDVFGNKVKSYQPFEDEVNDDLLGRMASETGGKYYRASKEDSLGPIFKDIDALEKTKIDVNKYTRYTEHYQRFLRWGLAFFALGNLLGLTLLRRSV